MEMMKKIMMKKLLFIKIDLKFKSVKKTLIPCYLFNKT